ncbi:MAG: aminotransferase class I/II-fold pyridoxal phosphate-dependent enzyme [Calditrichaeota bacterium]|nr:MAG: aminotransferase class I/II-fold pyridoxal phosphate-dependent enzyme [Calditrichota bacterium]
MARFHPFVMERMMSKFEQQVEYNLSESGVHPLRLGELLEQMPGAVESLLATELNYPHVNGIPELRSHIARLYEGATPENVLVTVGAIEANYLAIRTLLSAGDQIAIMLPNYMQIWGVAKNHDLDIATFHLREDRGWAPDLDELEAAVTPGTKLIAVCNPNNPTGHILTEAEMDRIIACAERVGAWILADEVYRGADRLADEENPSFYGRYDKVLAIGSMSKAYGLPGLRLGWVVAPPETIDEIWARHEYIAISASMLSNHLAAIALSPKVRPWLLQRTRQFIRRGFPVLQEWINRSAGAITLHPPDAAAIAFVRYSLPINSTEFTERLRREKSVLIVPGDHFGMDHFLRISFGLPHDYLSEGLRRILDLVDELRHE